MVGSTFFGLDISQLTARLLLIRRKISKRVLLLEFRSDSLLLAEATLTQVGVQLSHTSSFPLPPEALDRGVPAEPLKMAGLIQDFCAEKKIPAHRAAVVLPPELAFQRLLDLPASLTKDEAREYVLNPANGLQIPFPLTQTDFDLFPVLMPVEQQSGDKCVYMLTAIPEVLVDPIVEMLQAADLELQLLELGSHSQLRNHAAELMTLAPQQVDLLLEMLPDCSNLMLVSCSGLLGSERLASIRNLPELALPDDQRAVALSSGVSVEDLVFKDESYLPLSDLDLRVLVSDLRASLERFHLNRHGAEIRRLVLTGVNSSHPLLADLLAETLGLQVVLSRPIAVTGLAGLAMDDLLVQSGLARLTGLALGLLPNDQLLACSLEGHASDAQASQHQNNAVAIADLLSSSEAQTGLDLVAVEASPVGVVAEETNAEQSVSTITTTAEVVGSLDSDDDLKPDAITDVAEKPDLFPVTQKQTTESDELTAGLLMAEHVSEELPESVVGEMPLDALSEDEWPSIATSASQYEADVDVLEDASLSKEQWPSIANITEAVEDEVPSVMESGVSDNFSIGAASPSSESNPNEDVAKPESLWPSIASAELTDEALVEEVVVKVDESEWPSIAADSTQETITSSIAPETSGSSKQTDKSSLQVADVDVAIPMNTSSTQSDDLELSNIEDSGLGMLAAESMSDPLHEYVIPDLNLTSETKESQKETDSQQSALEASGSADVSHELGELRFADED